MIMTKLPTQCLSLIILIYFKIGNQFVTIREELTSSNAVANEKTSNIVHPQNPAKSFFYVSFNSEKSNSQA